MKKINKKIWKILGIFFLSLLASCASTQPKIKSVSESPSWNLNEQNSGVLDYIKGRGLLITPSTAYRYIELGKIYGNIFVPSLVPGEGLILTENGNFILPNEYVVKFAEMNRNYKR